MSTDAQVTPQAAGNHVAGPEPTTPDRQEAAAAPPAPAEAEPEATTAEAEAEEAITDEAPQTTTTRPKPKLCGICEQVEAKYKCPRCALPYCSVACFRPHKEDHPPDDPKPAPAPAPPQAAAPAKRKAHHPFSVLDDSPELAHLFRRYPGLPARLEGIHAATLPPREEEPGRGGLPWNLQQAPGYQGNKKPRWTHDTGLRDGKEALRKARTNPGEDGDAVREYCELVLHLLSREEATANVTDIVRQQVTQEDVKLIEKLIKAEAKWN